MEIESVGRSVRTSRNECLFDAVYRDRANSLPPKTIESWAVYTAWIHRWYGSGLVRFQYTTDQSESNEQYLGLTTVVTEKNVA
jgi:hypothetical protein